MDPRPVPSRARSESIVASLLKTGEDVRSGAAPDPGYRLRRLRVRRYMQPAPMAVDPEMSIAEVGERMRALGVDCLPVVEGGRLVGVVRWRDLEALLDLRGASGSETDDD